MILHLTSIGRDNAEEALQKLNGTVIGKQTVRLSWGRNPANKQVYILPPFLSRATLHPISLSLPCQDVIGINVNSFCLKNKNQYHQRVPVVVSLFGNVFICKFCGIAFYLRLNEALTAYFVRK
jgi:hypothetical protein